ncbi:extracellular solute-binding protein [Actinotignum schaalii]|uniref:extracellular solute-binding protein n=1 Tax=Actinomycetaceae TaxID=2049 RepID=UPI00237DDFA4|nr:extracellular solute-binding protein [Actinotignum schaalii]MDE1654812.1 extracellular solute-binding protein [Actinotignum schaalii]
MKRTLLRAGVAALAALGLGLGACGGAKPSGGAEGASAWALTGGAQEVVRAAFDKWNSDNPDRQIAVEYMGNDAYKEKIRTAVNTPQSPTLVWSWGGGTLRDYVNNGMVVDLTDSTTELQNKLFPAILETGKVDGKVYALPVNQAQGVYFYLNKEVLDAHGLSVPQTWDDLLTAVKTLKAAGVTPIALAGQSQWPYLMWIQYLTDRIGGPEVFQRVLDGEPGAWSDPAILKALEMIQELVELGAFGDAYGSVTADAGGDIAMVHTGKAAMVLQGAWVWTSFHEDNPTFASSGNLLYSTFPTIAGGKGNPKNLVGNPANYWSVSAKASEDAQKTVTDYLNTINLNDAYVDHLLEIGAVPGVKGIDDKIAKAKDSDYLSFIYNSLGDAEHFQLSWDQALPSEQSQALLTNLSQVFLLQLTPQQFVDNMNATL